MSILPSTALHESNCAINEFSNSRLYELTSDDRVEIRRPTRSHLIVRDLRHWQTRDAELLLELFVQRAALLSALRLSLQHRSYVSMQSLLTNFAAVCTQPLQRPAQ